MTLTHSPLARLTAAKAVANTSLRWIPPFLPTLERAFGASTTQLTTILGAGEMAGLSTILLGRELDRGRERTVMVAALAAVSASSVVALGGTVVTFAIAIVLLILGVANFTVAGHAWISHRVDYRWRARSIGLFETSWALALLLGGPLVAVLINLFGWRGPFVALAIGTGLASVGVALTLPRASTAPPGSTAGSATGPTAGRPPPTRGRTPVTPSAILTMLGSALLAAAGLSVFVVSGSWLDDEFGVSTGGVGYVVMGFGAVELIASGSTAAFADRLGKFRSTLGGACTLLVGLLVMVSANGRLALGVIGLLVFLIGFEFGFVTSFALVSEAMPDARGATLATSNAIGTLARGGGSIASGWLFGAHGIEGTAALGAAAGVCSIACFVLSRPGLHRGS